MSSPKSVSAYVQALEGRWQAQADEATAARTSSYKEASLYVSVAATVLGAFSAGTAALVISGVWAAFLSFAANANGNPNSDDYKTRASTNAARLLGLAIMPPQPDELWGGSFREIGNAFETWVSSLEATGESQVQALETLGHTLAAHGQDPIVVGAASIAEWRNLDYHRTADGTDVLTGIETHPPDVLEPCWLGMLAAVTFGLPPKSLWPTVSQYWIDWFANQDPEAHATYAWPPETYKDQSAEGVNWFQRYADTAQFALNAAMTATGVSYGSSVSNDAPTADASPPSPMRSRADLVGGYGAVSPILARPATPTIVRGQPARAAIGASSPILRVRLAALAPATRKARSSIRTPSQDAPSASLSTGQKVAIALGALASLSSVIAVGVRLSRRGA